MNTNILTAILKMLAVIFPVLKYKGVTADNPIVILCENVGETTDALTNLVRNFCEPGNYRKKLKELLGTGTDFLFCVYDGSFKASSMLGKIKQILETGEYNGKTINKLPIIFSKSVIDEDVLPEAFYIDFTENEGDYVDIFEYVPKPEDLSVVFEKIEEKSAELAGTDLLLKAAACSFYPELKKAEKIELYDMTLKLADEIIVKSEVIADAEGLEELFIDHLYTTGGNYELIPKDSITELSNGWKSKLYYSAEFLYVNESLMKELVKPLLKFTTYKALKAELAAKGIISTNSSNTFTSKMNIKNADGSYQRVTMLKFSREELTIPGELDIVSYLEGGFSA